MFIDRCSGVASGRFESFRKDLLFGEVTTVNAVFPASEPGSIQGLLRLLVAWIPHHVREDSPARDSNMAGGSMDHESTCNGVMHRCLDAFRMAKRFSMGRRLVLLLGLAVLLSSCGLLGKSGPEEARLSVQFDAGEEVQMITSTRFLTNRIQEIAEDGSVVDSLSILILAADTFSISNAFDSTYDISIDQRFYVRLIRSAPGGDNLNARVWVDDDLKFTSRPDDPRDSLQFIYNFAGPPGRGSEEL